MTESADSPSRVRPPTPGNATPNAPDSTARPNGRTDSYLNLTEEERLAIATMVTEDDTPVDNWFSEKQRRLLVDPLYASWQGPGEGRPFVAASDVGVFRSPLEPPLVPDAFVSLDVLHPQDWWEKPNRVYAIWQYMKPPDIVIEVVSNREGGETGQKMDRYASFGVPCYVVFDPRDHLRSGVLHAFERNAAGIYVQCRLDPLPVAGLGLKLWRGAYEDREETWLRWVDAAGELLLTGRERAEQAEDRAEQAEDRAEQAEDRVEQADDRADQAEERIQRLTAQLRAHGISPENGSDPS